jgi:LPXTG-site transpeptidase (sortase) family protein
VCSSDLGLHTNTINPADITNTTPTGSRTIPNAISAEFTVHDISVSKDFASNIIGVNGVTRLTITLTNNHDVSLTNLAFTDTLPDAADGIFIATPANLINLCDLPVTAIAGTKTISLSGGSLTANQVCTISVDVMGTLPKKTYTNTIPIGGVTGNVDGDTPTQNWHAASDSLTVGTPDFRINKKFDPILVTGDTASTMTVTLVNPESSPISGIAFTDTLPVNMLLANPPSPSVGTCGGTITPNADRKSFVFSGGSLPGNGQCKLTIKAMMDVTGNRINTIDALSVTTTQGATNLQSTSATLTNLSSVAVTKKFSPNPVTPGGISHLTLTIKKVGIGIGLTGLGVTDTLPEGLTIADPPSATTDCGGTLTTPSGGTEIRLTGGGMPIGTTTCTIVVNIKASEDGLNPDGYQNCIPAGTVVTDEGYTNIMDACDTLDTIFDPPLGIKVLNAANLPELEWKMVWINDSNSSAIDVQIKDPIPVGTTFVPGSMSCEARGSSNFDPANCMYDSVNNRVFWQGTIGPDRGATNEDTAENEVVIIFRVNVPNTINLVNNQATSTTDRNGDEDFADETSPASISLSNIATWSRFTRRGGSGGDDEPSTLPNSGFAHNTVTLLPDKPKNIYQSYSDLRIEIPSLNLETDIVGLSLKNGKWDVSWLENQLGYLEETAFPTWNGNSVITGHVYDANGKPGPFSNLSQMRYGEPIIIEAYGQKFTYEVREVLTIAPDDIKAALKHQELPWITLLTCQGYNEKDKSYSSRIIVRAVLVKLE